MNSYNVICMEKYDFPPLQLTVNGALADHTKTYHQDCTNSYELATISGKIVTNCHLSVL